MTMCFIDGVPSTLTNSMLLFHGHSVFTTLLARNAQPLLWERHWERITNQASYFDFPLPPRESVEKTIRDYLCQTKIAQKIRVVVGKSHHAITFEPFEPLDRRHYDGVSVRLTRFMVHPQLAEFKTANSLPYMLALKEAEQAGAFEGLLTNPRGYVVDGARTSLMIYDDSKIISVLGGLKGIMREEVLTYAEARGIRVEHAYLNPGNIENGQLLLANCLMGVVPVGKPSSSFVKEMVEYFRRY